MSIFFLSSAAWPWSRARGTKSRGGRRSAMAARRRHGRRGTASGLGTEMLEQRALMAVTATLSGTTLEIALGAADDAATLASDGTNYSVTGSGIISPVTFAVGDVNNVVVAGTAAADQAFTVGKGTAIASPVDVSTSVESTTISGAISTQSVDDIRIGSGAITLANDVTNFGGSVIFGGAVTLAADVTVTSLFTTAFDKELRFAGPVDGGYKLTTVNGQLNAYFDDVVGGKTPLASLTTSNQSAGGRISLQSVTTTGGQQYGENPTLQGVYTTSGGAFGVGRALTLGGDTSVSTAGGNVTLSSTVNGAKNLGIAAGAGQVKFTKAVGSITPLASLWITSAGSVTASSTVKLDGSAPGANRHGLSIASGVNNVTMKAGGTIKNYIGSGIVLGGSTGSAISGFASTSNGGSGLKASGTFTGTTLSGNTFRLNSTGVSLNDAQALTVGGNNNISDNTVYGVAVSGNSAGSVITGNVIARNGVGVSLTNATGVEISNKGGVANTISSSVNYGVFATGDCSGSVVAGNVIMQNSQGLVLSAAQGLKIGAGNAVVKNTNAGLAVYGASAGTTVVGSSFLNNSIGILLSDATGLEISNKGGVANNISSNVNYGVFASGNCAGSFIAGNAITQNAQGLVLSAAQGLKIDAGNAIVGNTNAGLLVSGASAGTTVVGSSYLNNGVGIMLSDATGLEVSNKGGVGNNISSNVNYGVFATGNNAGSFITGNAIMQNSLGLVLSGAQGLKVDAGNAVIGNTNAGLAVSGASAGTTVVGSSYLNNGVGISLSDATGLEISNKGGVGNNISSNVNYGVFATGNSAGSFITGNVISQNALGIVLSGAQGFKVDPGNAVVNNKNAGLLVSGASAGTTVTGSQFINDAIGVIISGATGLAFGGAGASSNTIGNNSAAGMLLSGVCTGTKLVGNWIGLNGIGINASAASGLTINGSNVLAASTGAAFVASGDCSDTIVSDNLFTSSSYGVLLNAATKLTVNGGNRLVSNSLFGLYASGLSGGTTVTGNEISGNGTNIDTSAAIGGVFQTS